MYASRAWTEHDIDTLHVLVKDKTPLRQMARILQRSPRAVECAIQKLMYQQILHHDAQDIMEYYDMSFEELEENIVPYKFYSPIPSHPSMTCAKWMMGALVTIGVPLYCVILCQQIAKL